MISLKHIYELADEPKSNPTQFLQKKNKQSK